MAAPDVFNVLKSGAVLWYAPEGEAEPDESSIAAGADWGGNWARVGLTQAPLTFAYEDEQAAIETEEFLASVLEFRMSEELMLETVLGEAAADYLQLMVEGTVSTTAAGASQVGFEELEVGGQNLKTVRAFGFEGVRVDDSGNQLPVRIFIARGVARLNGELEFSKREDSYVGLPLQIKALADPDNSGVICKFQRVTAPATG